MCVWPLSRLRREPDREADEDASRRAVEPATGARPGHPSDDAVRERDEDDEIEHPLDDEDRAEEQRRRRDVPAVRDEARQESDEEDAHLRVKQVGGQPGEIAGAEQTAAPHRGPDVATAAALLAPRSAAAT